METESLVEKFGQNPGLENQELDFKSKEILNSTEQKKKLVRCLSAMANKEGGTVIVGVRIEDGELKIQDFGVNEEPRQEITHIAQSYTNPPLSYLWHISFDVCRGNRLMRIDVKEATNDLVRFDYKGEYKPFIREEDGIREMSIDEVAKFFRRAHLERRFSNSGTISQRESIEATPTPIDEELPSEFENRAVSWVSGDYSIVFGSGILRDRFNKSITYSLEGGPPSYATYDAIVELLELAEERLGARTNWNFGYAISMGDLQIMGCSLTSLKKDLSRLDEISAFLMENTTTDSNYGPRISGFTRYDTGTLWFEVQKEGERFHRWNVEMILPDIPFDDSGLKNFFGELGTDPHTYSHDNGLQFVHFDGRDFGPLENPDPIDLQDDNEYGTLHVSVDNPFYDWPDQVEQSLEYSVPDWCSVGLSSATRIPFQVSGGYLNDEPDHFTVNYFATGYVRGIHPTILVDCSCWQSTSEDIDSVWTG